MKANSRPNIETIRVCDMGMVQTPLPDAKSEGHATLNAEIFFDLLCSTLWVSFGQAREWERKLFRVGIGG